MVKEEVEEVEGVEGVEGVQIFLYTGTLVLTLFFTAL